MRKILISVVCLGVLLVMVNYFSHGVIPSDESAALNKILDNQKRYERSSLVMYSKNRIADLSQEKIDDINILMQQLIPTLRPVSKLKGNVNLYKFSIKNTIVHRYPPELYRNAAPITLYFPYHTNVLIVTYDDENHYKVMGDKETIKKFRKVVE